MTDYLEEDKELVQSLQPSEVCALTYFFCAYLATYYIDILGHKSNINVSQYKGKYK